MRFQREREREIEREAYALRSLTLIYSYSLKERLAYERASRKRFLSSDPSLHLRLARLLFIIRPHRISSFITCYRNVGDTKKGKLMQEKRNLHV